MSSLRRLSLILVLAFILPAIGYGQVKTLKVGFIPITDFLPLYAAIEKGYFTDQGLKAELTTMAGGAAIMPAIVGGSLDLGIAAAVPLIIAHAQGFDFKIVADCAYIDKEVGLVVRKDSGIKEYKDLEGKSVATNLTKGVGWLFLREAMLRAGANPEKMTWVEIPFPQMMGPLLGKQVDAAHSAEPFVTIMKDDPALVVIKQHFYEVNPGGILAEIVGSSSWIKKNPDLASRFARAMKQGVDYVNSNLAEARGLLPKYTGLKPELAQRVNLTLYKKSVDIKNLQWTADLMLKHGLINKKIKAEDLVYETAR